MARPYVTILAAALCATPVGAAADNHPDARGVVRQFDFQNVDDLLDLGPSVRMIMFVGADEVTISSAHLEMFKRWISAGGIAYFYQGGWGCSLNRKLGLVEAAPIYVTKENGANMGGSTGELVVRDLFPYLTIAPHRITEGVRKLYLCNASTEFRPLNGARMLPILQVGSSTDFGANVFINAAENLALPPETRANFSFRHLAAVYAAIEMGRGLIIYDGTSMVAGPNGFNGNSYDWPRMFQNVLDYAGAR